MKKLLTLEKIKRIKDILGVDFVMDLRPDITFETKELEETVRGLQDALKKCEELETQLDNILNQNVSFKRK